MSKLSIRIKIVTVIGFFIVSMSVLGLVAVRSVQSINTHTVEIATNWLPSVRVLGDLRTDINLFRVALRAHCMAQTLEAKDAGEKRLAGILEAIKKDRTAYESKISSPEEGTIYDEWSRAWDKYLTGVADVIKESRNSVGRIPVEASELLTKSVAVMAAESDKILKRDIDLNDAGAETATKAAAEGYNTT